MTIPTQSCVSGFIVSMGSLEQTGAGVHYVRARVGVTAPSNGLVDAGPSGSRVYFFLYVYGDAAERVSRRFRRGDVFIASGRVGHVPPTGSVFVADRIGHDAKRTTYRVVRSRRATRRADRGREPVTPVAATARAAASVVAAVPVPRAV